MKNEKLNERVINYFEMMIDDFCNGNDNEYKVGSRVSFKYEEIEKIDLDNYEEEDVEDFIYIREFIKNEGGEVKYIGKFDDEDLEYNFKLVNKKKDIKCSWIEPKWKPF
jgi:hypothetical protein